MKYKGYQIDERTESYQRKEWQYHNEYEWVTDYDTTYYVTGRGFRGKEFSCEITAKHNINRYLRRQDKPKFRKKFHHSSRFNELCWC